MTHALVLLKEQQSKTSDPICVSTNIDTLMECAEAENLDCDMRALRVVGSYVPIEDGEAALHLEHTKIV